MACSISFIGSLAQMDENVGANQIIFEPFSENWRWSRTM